MALAKKSFPIVLTALVILILINTAMARILPESSYISDSIENGGITIDFAVYKTLELQFEDETQFVGTMTDTKYLYAYQVYNSDGSDLDIDVFSLLGLGIDAITSQDYISNVEDSLGDHSLDDLSDHNNHGLPPSDSLYGSEYSTGIEFGYASWFFDENYIDEGDHSRWLIIQSDNAPVIGQYILEEIDGVPAAGGQGSPLSTVPEPVTITLLGIGGLFVRKTKKA